jgi:GTP-binding protein
MTNATSRIGAYPFTTLEPHLGDLYGFILADIPGLIEGASGGKGLGYKFLRHVSRTKMLLHVVSLEQEDPVAAYYTIRKELDQYDTSLSAKEEWIILTKNDLVEQSFTDQMIKELAKTNNRVLVTDAQDEETYKTLRDALVSYLRATFNS